MWKKDVKRLPRSLRDSPDDDKEQNLLNDHDNKGRQPDLDNISSSGRAEKQALKELEELRLGGPKPQRSSPTQQF